MTCDLSDLSDLSVTLNVVRVICVTLALGQVRACNPLFGETAASESTSLVCERCRVTHSNLKRQRNAASSKFEFLNGMCRRRKQLQLEATVWKDLHCQLPTKHSQVLRDWNLGEVVTALTCSTSSRKTYRNEVLRFCIVQ